MCDSVALCLTIYSCRQDGGAEWVTPQFLEDHHFPAYRAQLVEANAEGVMCRRVAGISSEPMIALMMSVVLRAAATRFASARVTGGRVEFPHAFTHYFGPRCEASGMRLHLFRVIMK